MKINIGSGTNPQPGYINVDANPDVGPDYVCFADDLNFCGPGEAEEIMMMAVYEHLFETERVRAIKEWARCLKPDGLLKILWIPDTEAAAQRYLLHCNDIYMFGQCQQKNCGPTPEFPHFDLEMLERVTSGAKGLHNEEVFQVHKSIFSKTKVKDELSKFGLFKISYCTSEIYPGELGGPYNICVSARRL